jgi:hypothetical protein
MKNAHCVHLLARSILFVECEGCKPLLGDRVWGFVPRSARRSWSEQPRVHTSEHDMEESKPPCERLTYYRTNGEFPVVDQHVGSWVSDDRVSVRGREKEDISRAASVYVNCCIAGRCASGKQNAVCRRRLPLIQECWSVNEEPRLASCSTESYAISNPNKYIRGQTYELHGHGSC